jgi:hypothetical protein
VLPQLRRANALVGSRWVTRRAAGGDFFAAYIEQGRQAYAQSSYWVAQQFRFVEWLLMFLNAIFFLPNVLVMFLLGLYFGKQGVFGQLAAHRGRMGLLAGVAIPVGFVLNALYAWGLLTRCAPRTRCKPMRG